MVALGVRRRDAICVLAWMGSGAILGVAAKAASNGGLSGLAVALGSPSATVIIAWLAGRSCDRRFTSAVTGLAAVEVSIVAFYAYDMLTRNLRLGAELHLALPWLAVGLIAGPVVGLIGFAARAPGKRGAVARALALSVALPYPAVAVVRVGGGKELIAAAILMLAGVGCVASTPWRSRVAVLAGSAAGWVALYGAFALLVLKPVVLDRA